jgi:SAM-dependent methyltransferase
MQMDSPEKIKEMVREKYAAIVEQSTSCGSSCGTNYSFVGDSYQKVDGYVAEADLGLGCGLPTEIAQIEAGQTVLDLGSGAGNDVFVARSIVGETGKVIGVDMTAAMIERARINAEKLGYTNVEFRLGEIESLPIDAASIDVVVSNCVLNLVPDKGAAFAEIARVLKPGGHFSISDIVVEGEIPVKLRQLAEAYAGCVAGAIAKTDYLRIIEEKGFHKVRIAKQRVIQIPDELLRKFVDDETIGELRASDNRLLSITVYAEKPAQN